MFYIKHLFFQCVKRSLTTHCECRVSLQWPYEGSRTFTSLHICSLATSLHINPSPIYSVNDIRVSRPFIDWTLINIPRCSCHKNWILHFVCENSRIQVNKYTTRLSLAINPWPYFTRKKVLEVNKILFSYSSIQYIIIGFVLCINTIRYSESLTSNVF